MKFFRKLIAGLIVSAFVTATFVFPVFAATLDQSYALYDTDIPIGGGNTIFLKTAQSFTVSADGEIDSVDIYIKKIGSPTDNVTVAIYSDSGGLPNAALSSVESFAASGIGTSLGWKNVVFSSKVSGVSGTKYHIVAQRSGSGDIPNYIAWGYKSAGGYSGGSGSNWNSSNGFWTDLGGDCDFKEYYNPLGWTHIAKVSSVALPAKVLGVAEASVAKINGVVTSQ